MANKIIIIFFLMTSTCYADIPYISKEDVKSHGKIRQTLNMIIYRVNTEDSKKASIQEVNIVNTHYQATAQDLQYLRGKLSSIRKTVGDPEATAVGIKTKFLLLMDTLDKSPVPQHTAVTP